MAAKETVIATVAEKAPVTSERQIRDDLDTKLSKPYVPRAVVAPDTENVNGTWGHKHNNMSVLQQHVAFFDQDDDGIIYPSETYRGFRILGFNPVASFIFMILVHITMSYATLPSWLPSPYFPIYIQNIHKAKHGSDSATYDTEGRYIPANLENIFSKYAHTVPDKLTLGELWHMTQCTRNAFDFFGWTASKLEWGLCMYLQRMKKVTYRKKQFGVALMAACFNIVPKLIKLLLLRWSEPSTDISEECGIVTFF